MQLFRNLSIRRKQMLIIMLTSSVALVLTCAAFVAYDLAFFRRDLAERTSTLAAVVANASTVALDFNESKPAEEALGAMRAEPNIVRACIYDRNGNIFVAYPDNTPAGKLGWPAPQRSGHVFSQNQLKLYRAIEQDGEMLGTLYVVSNLDEFVERLKRYGTVAGLVLVGSLFVAFLLSSQLQRIISTPILHLAATAQAVAREKNYSLRATAHGNDELGRFIIGFNEMLAQIQARDIELGNARDQLERRVQSRTKELAQSVSLLNATLEASVDGVLAIDLQPKITCYNHKFTELWQFPAEVIQRRDLKEMTRLAAAQVKDPEMFKMRILELLQAPEREAFDILDFKDGRIVERIMRPQRIDERCVGNVFTYRDITERKRAESAVRDSQALYHSLVEQMPSGVFRKDARGRFVFVNSWFCRLKGLTANELLGKTPKELAAYEFTKRGGVVPSEAWEAALAARGASHHETIMRTGEQIEVEEQYPRANGHVQYLQVVKSPIFGANGAIVGSQGLQFDITERKQADEILRKSESQFRLVWDTSAEGMRLTDQNGNMVMVNDAYCRMVELPKAELEGKPLTVIHHADNAAKVLQNHQTRISSGELRWHLETEATLWNGRKVWFEMSNSILNLPGQARLLLSVFRDVTQRKQAEAELDSMHRQLLGVSRQAGMAEVATSVLHNVGNVLNSVNTSASVVADRLRSSQISGVQRVSDLLEANRKDLPGFLSTNGRADQVINFMKSLSQHLTAERASAVEELQELSKNIEHIKEIVVMQQSYAKVSGVTEKVSVIELVEDALRMNAGALVRHQVRLVRDFAPPLPEILVEKHKVLQILVNLIRNAKYACDESHSHDKCLILRIEALPDRVRISVIDNGVGIPAENLNRIFNHGFTTRKHGHGFGLHSGALAAKELNGSLTVHSEGPGCGATFVLELPLGQTQLALPTLTGVARSPEFSVPQGVVTKRESL